MTKIMLVDDDPDTIISSKMMLQSEGYEVVEIRNGNDCLDNILKEKPDLVLLDVMMPGMDGWEVCKQIKGDKETSPIPVVMFTVCTSGYDKKKSFDYSKADAQIDKPFTKQELLDAIERVLKSSI